MTAVLTPRESVRAHLRDRCKEVLQVVSGGPWDGRHVIAEEDLDAILAEPLPPADDHGADVRTPAEAIVTADCPKCGLPATIRLAIDSELRVNADGSTLRLKGKSKEATHLCGQTAVWESDGQTGTFEIDDIVGREETDAE